MHSPIYYANHQHLFVLFDNLLSYLPDNEQLVYTAPFFMECSWSCSSSTYLSVITPPILLSKTPTYVYLTRNAQQANGMAVPALGFCFIYGLEQSLLSDSPSEHSHSSIPGLQSCAATVPLFHHLLSAFL